MAKRLMMKVGTYKDREGKDKNEWMRLGVLLENNNGEYALVDPAVNLAGVMMKQRMLDPSKKGDMVMVGVFDDDNARQAPNNTSKPQAAGPTDFDSDIPF